MITVLRPLLPAIAVALCVLLSGCAADTPQSSGADLYAANCAVCHGPFGDGEGPAAINIPQTVPDLRQIALLNDGTFPRDLVRRIVDGRDIVDAHRSQVMPRWGEEFSLDEGASASAQRRVNARIDALVDYIESIQLRD